MIKKKEIFLVPYSHLDTQWRWEYPTTIKKYIKKTIDENVYLFDKYKEYHFNFTGTLRYKMMKEYFPQEFEKVKILIDEERWHLAGTCLDETDTLVPSIESNIRNILYGDRWQKQEFGCTSKDYMIPDCFGFPINLPTVLNHCGIHGLSSNKLTWESAVGVPFEIGIWEGPDGSEIVSAFNPCKYDSHLELPVFLNFGRLSRLYRLGKNNDIWKSFQYYGVGDIGGAPLEKSVINAIKSINYYSKSNSDIVVKQGAADTFFENITQVEKSKMDRYKGDLLLIKHSAGTLTSATIMKRWNRKNEQLAFAAEAAAVQAYLISGIPYPNEKIKVAWERICGSQMHDILPGTSTPLAYEYSQNDEVLALNTWTSILIDSARAIAPFVEGDGNVIIFNPLENNRNELVDIVVQNLDLSTSYMMEDAKGRKYPVQIKVENNQIKATFKPLLLPFSWTKFKLVEGKNSFNSDLSIIENVESYILKNNFYKITVLKDGCIISIMDLTRKRELLKEPLAYEFQKERPQKFPAWNMDWTDRKMKPFLSLSNGGYVKVIEDGDLRKTLQITLKYDKSTFIKEVSLCSDSDLIEFKESIDWLQSGCSLKLAFHTNMNNPIATYNWESDRINRPINNNKQYEVPSRMWVDLSQDNFGFSIVEDCKYGYDRPSEAVIRMTLIYTPAIWYFNGFWDQKSQDFGKHTIRYGIRSHSGSWCETDQVARKFNQKIRSFDVAVTNEEIRNSELLKMDTVQLGLSSIKKAEDEDAIIIRMYERHGKDVMSHITFPQAIKDAYVVNGIEEHIEKATFHNNQLYVDVVANGIKAYMIMFDTKKHSRLQESLKLPYNYTAIASNNVKGDAIFPRELIPKSIQWCDLSFDIVLDENLNAVKTNGQILNINNDFNTLSFLAASENGEVVTFSWLDSNNKVVKEDEVNIPKISGFRGLWDTRIWKKAPTHYLKNKRDYAWINKCIGIMPGYVHRNRVEWYSTHTHDNGEDCEYKYGYLYNITLNIPQNAISILLPSNEILILSAIQFNEKCYIESSQYLYDGFDF